MNTPFRGFGVQAAPARSQALFDEGLRQHMLRVYNYMGVGLVVTGLVAYGTFLLSTTNDPALAVATVRGSMLTPTGYALFASPLKWVLMLAPLAFIMFLSFRIERVSFATAQTLFYAFCAVMGLSMASIFLVFTGGSIAQTFFITASVFGIMSLYGYTTKRDLSGMGSFLMMGLIGVVVASLINLFLQSTALQFAVSAIGVLVFTGLTAYDTQRIKEEYSEHYGTEAAGKIAVMSALSLYLNFINLFQLLLNFTGQREE